MSELAGIAAQVAREGPLSRMGEFVILQTAQGLGHKGTRRTSKWLRGKMRHFVRLQMSILPAAELTDITLVRFFPRVNSSVNFQISDRPRRKTALLAAKRTLLRMLHHVRFQQLRRYAPIITLFTFDWLHGEVREFVRLQVVKLYAGKRADVAGEHFPIGVQIFMPF